MPFLHMFEVLSRDGEGGGFDVIGKQAVYAALMLEGSWSMRLSNCSYVDLSIFPSKSP